MGSKKITPAEPLADKVLPQNLEAESAVLGAMLINEQAVPEVMEVLEERFFYKDAHKIIFSAIASLFSARRNIDIITVSEEITKRKQMDQAGGRAYIASLADSTPSSTNVISYARIVKEKWIRRSLLASSNEILNLCFDESRDINFLLDKSERLIFDISEKKVERSYVHIKEVIKDSIEMIDSLYQKKTHVTGIASGFDKFDEKTSGFHKGELIVIAGRPSMGKSAFVSCIAEHAAIERNIPVGIFSVEMSKEQLSLRFLCSQAKVDANKLRTGFLSVAEWPMLTAAASKISNAPIFIDDTPGMNIFELRAKARRMKLHQGVELLIVDYLQLLRTAYRAESRQQEVSEISRSLKALAKEIDVPVIVVSQLSREVEKREGKKPQLSDLRESGAIEQDADLVALLFREDYYNKDTENKGITEVIIAKQRNGPTGTVNLGFIKEYMKFVNLDVNHTSFLEEAPM